MTRLRHYRLSSKQTLREVAEKIGITIATVHDAEVRGILTPRLAKKYSAAFPGVSWLDLLEPPRTGATDSNNGTQFDMNFNHTTT